MKQPGSLNGGLASSASTEGAFFPDDTFCTLAGRSSSTQIHVQVPISTHFKYTPYLHRTANCAAAFCFSSTLPPPYIYRTWQTVR